MPRASESARWSEEKSEDESQWVIVPAASHRSRTDAVPQPGSVAKADRSAATVSGISKYSVLIFLNVFPDVTACKERRVNTVVATLGLDDSMWKVNFADAQDVGFVA